MAKVAHGDRVRVHFEASLADGTVFDSSESETPLEFEDWDSAVDVRTRDNNIVSVDVTVTYRIRESLGHKLVEEGYKASYRDQVRSRAKTVIRQDLGNLHPGGVGSEKAVEMIRDEGNRSAVRGDAKKLGQPIPGLGSFQ